MTLPRRILLVEDNPDDVLLTAAGFREANWPSELSVVTDGQQAWDLLSADAHDDNHPSVDLILLDLDLPKVSGHELLDMMVADKRLSHTPVVILSGNAIVESTLGDHRHRVAGVLSKPDDADGYREVVDDLKDIWQGLKSVRSGG